MLGTAAVRDTWLTKLQSDLESGVLTETKSVTDYRDILNSIPDDTAYEDVDWPEYPSA